MGTIKITINTTQKEYRTPLTYEQLAEEYQPKYAHRIVLAVANQKIRELHKNITRDAEVAFETIADRVGHDTYVRSACMLLMKALSDVAGSPVGGEAAMEYTVGRGYYCMPKGSLAQRVVRMQEGGERIDEAFVAQVKERMLRLVEADLAIVKRAYPTDEAIELFRAQGMDDKVRLFRYRRGSFINVYCLDGYYDYNYGYMVPRTGYLEYFDLIPYKGGMMLLLPDRTRPEEVDAFEPREKFLKP